MTTQENTINRRLEAILHAGIWIAFLLAYVLIFGRFMPYKLSVARALINVLPMAFLFYCNLWLVDKFIERKNYFTFAIITILLFFGATLFRVELNALFPDVRREIMDMSKKEGWFLGAFFTNLSFVVVGVFYQMLYNRYRTEQRNLAIINEQKEAQIQFLRGQINPHFLFNTLNNIYSLAVVKSDKTALMVLKLSNLLRYVIYESRSEQIELIREVAHIQQFIELFQMRSEETLSIRFDKIGTIEGIKIEPMILIPLVENCFKHCDFDTNEAAFVQIYLQVDTKKLHFKTINSKNDQDHQKDHVGGVGLENIRKRLELKYKDAHTLIIDNKKTLFEIDLKVNIS